MTLVLLVGMVQAAGMDAPIELPVPPAEESVGASKDSDAPASSSDSGSKKDAELPTLFKKGKIWGWNYRPYVSPGGGLTIGSGGASVTGGADVGVKYWRKEWNGDLSAGGSYTSGTALTGYDMHLGNEFGRREKWWGVSLGAFGFYNFYATTEATTSLEPSIGLDVPLQLTLGPKKYYAWGSITPSFLLNQDRHVPGLPFGDELEWGVGVGVKLKWITAEAGFTSRITAVGVINTPTISLSLD